MKKDEGNAARLVTIIFVVMAIAILCIGFLGCMDILYKKNPISQISRKYMLKMETSGYLTAEERAFLIEDLRAAGLTDISLAGTTLNPVEYGNKINLYIFGKLRYQNTDITDLFHIVFSQKAAEVYEKRESTAKN